MNNSNFYGFYILDSMFRLPVGRNRGHDSMFLWTPIDQDLFNFTNNIHNYPISRENTFKATSKSDEGGADRFARIPVMILGYI
jgi:hypothetical protein